MSAGRTHSASPGGGLWRVAGYRPSDCDRLAAGQDGKLWKLDSCIGERRLMTVTP